MLMRIAAQLTGIAALVSVAFATPASATILNTATQTLSYGANVGANLPAWVHTFAFNRYVSPGPGTTFNSVHLTITGTQQTSAGTLTCYVGGGGFGSGAASCNGLYSQQSNFSLTSSPLPGAIPTLSPAQGGPINLIESNFFVQPVVLSQMAIPATTTASSYTYYNTVTASGGTLNPALFTGPGTVNFTFTANPLSVLTLFLGGGAGINFGAVYDTLTASLYYDYIATPEPAALALFGVGALGLVISRRRRRKT